MGTSQQQIQRIESGRQSIRFELATRIAAALDAPLDQVFPESPIALQRSGANKRTRVLQLEVVEASDTSIIEALLREAQHELEQLSNSRGRHADELASLAFHQIGVARDALELRRKWITAERRKDRASA